MRSVDAHVHLWNRSTDPQPWIDADTMPELDRDFGVADLEAMLDDCEIQDAIVIQAGNSSQETVRLLDLAAAGGAASRVGGIVGWIDLTTDVDAQLAALGDKRNLLVGARHLVHVDDDQAWLGRPDVARGLDRLGAHHLGFDLVLRSTQLSLAAEVTSAHPGTRFVLDHLGGIAETDDDMGWETALRVLARNPNVSAKISGLAAMARTPERQRRAVAVAIDAFTPDRLMYGSDWPLTQLSSGVLAWHREVLEIVETLALDEQARVLAGTAIEHYRLEEA